MAPQDMVTGPGGVSDALAQAPRVLLVMSNPFLLAASEEQLCTRFRIVGTAGNGGDAVRLALELQPDIVVLETGLSVHSGFEVSDLLTSLYRDLLVVLLTGRETFEEAQMAMQVGARSYLPLSMDPVQLTDSLANIWSGHAARLMARYTDTQVVGAGIWSFYGASDGDGRSTLLLSVANTLVRSGRRVAVVDMDLLFGDLAFYLGLPEVKPDMSTLLATERYLEPKTLREHIRVHRSGIHLLPAPFHTERAVEVDRDEAFSVLEALPRLYDYVLVDLPQGFPVGQEGLLHSSRVVFLVGSGRASSLKDFEILLRLVENSKVPREKLVGVMMGGETLEGARPFLKRHPWVHHRLPLPEKSVDHAIRSGLPFNACFPRDRFSRAVDLMLESVLGELRVQNLREHVDPTGGTS